jgi:hypothetical protein
MGLTGLRLFDKRIKIKCLRSDMIYSGLNRLMKFIICILLTAALLVAGNSFATDAPKANPFTKVLTAVPAVELPAKAADLVSQAKTRARHAATVSVVKAALGINPAAAPAIVGAIARAVPEMAAIAAGTAAAEQPKQASVIAKAAAAAAPEQAGAIVEAVCRAVPNEYRNIATTVSQAVPGAGESIVKAVGSALPGQKPSIESMLAGYGGNVLSVAVTLDQAAQVKAAPGTAYPTVASTPSTPMMRGASLARGPASAPPYIPLSVTPTNVTSGGSGEVPGGGRNYAAP